MNPYDLQMLQAIAAQQQAAGAYQNQLMHALQNARPGGIVPLNYWEELKPVKNEGIKVGEIIAWRAWKFHHGWLYSCYVDTEWPPGEVMKAHKIGQKAGDGIHVFKRRLDAINYSCSDHAYGGPARDIYAVGQVALWGEVIEFERGWHGEYAKIHRIEMLDGKVEGPELEKLRVLYGVANRGQDML